MKKFKKGTKLNYVHLAELAGKQPFRNPLKHINPSEIKNNRFYME